MECVARAAVACAAVGAVRGAQRVRMRVAAVEVFALNREDAWCELTVSDMTNRPMGDGDVAYVCEPCVCVFGARVAF